MQTFKRVLVIDDAENVRFLLQRGLARMGSDLKVRVAHSGYQALEFLKGEPFDLIITDYQMPHMNGLELTRTIRRSYPDVKIILMTACPSVQVTEQFSELAVDGYLVKPFSTRRLRGIVHDLLISPGLSFPSTGDNGHDRESKNPHR